MTCIGITLGDPAGIGPEVTAAALRLWGAQSVVDSARGAASGLESPIHWRVFGPAGVADRLDFGPHADVALTLGPRFDGPLAQASAAGGSAALGALYAGIRAAQAGELAALVTAPVHKGALRLAGAQDLGHTEILRRELGVGPVGMAFFAPRLQVILATAHIPLRQVFSELSAARVLEVATLLHAALGRYRQLSAPRLALAGLNPHASEGGLMGDEEARLLQPAVVEARRLGIDLSAPQSPDSVFRQAVDGAYDGVVALYHDQGLIPVKLLSFGEAINVTLGLQVPRTSPDHGTAFDRVGTSTARPDGMLGALKVAVQMATGAPVPV